jgi:hypothetical protein
LLAVVAVTGSSSLPFFVVGVLLSVSLLALWRIPRQPRRAVGQRAVKLSVRRDVMAGYRELRGEQVLHRRMVTYGLFTLIGIAAASIDVPLIMIVQQRIGEDNVRQETWRAGQYPVMIGSPLSEFIK